MTELRHGGESPPLLVIAKGKVGISILGCIDGNRGEELMGISSSGDLLFETPGERDGNGGPRDGTLKHRDIDPASLTRHRPFVEGLHQFPKGVFAGAHIR